MDIATCSRGQYFGELALVTNKPRAASAYAVGSVKCLGILPLLCGLCLKFLIYSSVLVLHFSQSLLESPPIRFEKNWTNKDGRHKDLRANNVSKPNHGLLLFFINVDLCQIRTYM